MKWSTTHGKRRKTAVRKAIFTWMSVNHSDIYTYLLTMTARDDSKIDELTDIPGFEAVADTIHPSMTGGVNPRHAL
jgi:hypothetical protein